MKEQLVSRTEKQNRMNKQKRQNWHSYVANLVVKQQLTTLNCLYYLNRGYHLLFHLGLQEMAKSET